MATAPDPMLAELNDPNINVSAPDGVAEPEVDPLDVLPKTPASPVKAANAKHSTAAGGKGFRVKVRGQYFAQSKDSDRKVLRSYEHDFNVPTLDGALGMIVGKLLDPALRKKFGDEYIHFRTHELVEAVPLSPTTPESNNLQFMSRPRLEAYIAEYHIPVKPEEYEDVVHLRAAVVDYTLNPKDFEVREAARQKERAEMKALAEMNPELEIQAP